MSLFYIFAILFNALFNRKLLHCHAEVYEENMYVVYAIY